MKKKKIEDIKYELKSLSEQKDSELKQLKAKIEYKTQINGNNSRSVEASNTNILKEKVKALESRLKNINKELEEDYLKDSNIVSDINNGVVNDVNFVVGDKVAARTKIVSLMSTENLFVEADIGEESIKNVQIGMHITFSLVADKSRKYKGKVIDISNVAKQENGETKVSTRISIDNRDDYLISGIMWMCR